MEKSDEIAALREHLRQAEERERQEYDRYYAALHAQREAEARAERAGYLRGKWKDLAARWQTRYRQEKARAERAEAHAQQMDAEREAWKRWCEKAEALLAKASYFRLDGGWILAARPNGEWWLYHRTASDPMSNLRKYPTLDAALAAYEQSREER